MNQETAALLRELAEKLGTTTEHLWGVLIAQARIEGWVDVGWLALLICVTVPFAKFCMQWLSKERQYNEEARGIILFVAGALLTVTWFATLARVPLMLAAFFNPEYWALHELMQRLK